MILIIREAPFIDELFEISHDRLLPYEEPLLLRFNCIVLQADDVAFGIGAIDTPSALAVFGTALALLGKTLVGVKQDCRQKNILAYGATGHE
jgi:hypothetical protein